MAIVILTSLSVGMSPFAPMQLLWINLIMDILAALALATEHPDPKDLRPIERGAGRFI